MYTEQVFRLLVAQVKIDRDREVNQLLAKVFARAIRLYRSQRPDEEPEGLDLKGSFLDRIDLAGLDLTNVDMAFASFRQSNLKGTKLRRALGYEVHLDGAVMSLADLTEARMINAIAPKTVFHKALMSSVKLRNANLKQAQFQQARLQSAHFEDADLSGAAFQEANINDTFFHGATFDDAALRTIVKAKNWTKAHFDPPILSHLRSISRARTEEKERGKGSK